MVVLKSLFRTASTAFLLALVLTPAVWGGTVDVSGDWTVQASFAIEPTEGDDGTTCSYEGQADATQGDGVLAGSASVSLTQGDASCPPEMSAGLDGFVNGTSVTFDLTDQNLGAGAFQGTAILEQRGLLGEVVAVEGSLDIVEGPFQGFTGSVTAQVTRGTVTEIPTFGTVAIVTFVGLLAALGVLLTRNRLLVG